MKKLLAFLLVLSFPAHAQVMQARSPFPLSSLPSGTSGLAIIGTGTTAPAYGVLGVSGGGTGTTYNYSINDPGETSTTTLSMGTVYSTSIGVVRENTATAGSASTITLDASASSTDDYYKGMNILIKGGTGQNQLRTISGYVGSTKVATVDANWTTNVANGSVFQITTANFVECFHSPNGTWSATDRAFRSDRFTITSGAVSSHRVHSSVRGFCAWQVPQLDDSGTAGGEGMFTAGGTVEFLASDNEIELPFFSYYTSMLIYVDNVLKYRIGSTQTMPLSTAQGGSANTITLASTASATDGYYNQLYVQIYSGTGAGQVRRIIAYNGTTKAATVASNWDTEPVSGSVYVINTSEVPYDHIVTNPYEVWYPKVTFSGERTIHHIKVAFSGGSFRGVVTSNSGDVWPIVENNKPTFVWVGDSFISGTGSAIGRSAARTFEKLVNGRVHPLGVGGTGFIGTAYTRSSGPFSVNYRYRTVPPVNSWFINLAGATAGTYTLTQGAVTTAAIAYNASLQTLQDRLDAAFGAGQWFVMGSAAGTGNRYIVECIGDNASSESPLSITSSLTVPGEFQPYTYKYTGDITPLVPRDSNGNALPFYILYQTTGNDMGYLATVQAEMESVLALTKQRFPTATVVLVGKWQNVGPANASDLSMQQKALAAATNALPTINGKPAFLETFNPTTGIGYLTGSSKVSSASGLPGLNTDMNVSLDGVHPSRWGHEAFARAVAAKFLDLVRNTTEAPSSGMAMQ